MRVRSRGAGGRGPRALTPGPVRLGLRENLGQFGLLVAVNALVGGTVGQERTVLPLLAEEVFGLGAYAAMLSFIAVSKAAARRCPLPGQGV